MSSNRFTRLSDRAGRDELSVSDLSVSTFGIVDSGVAGSMLGTGIMFGAQTANLIIEPVVFLIQVFLKEKKARFF